MSEKSVNIAILGIGVVGYATYQNIYKFQDSIFKKTGVTLNVTKILEKEPEKHINRVDKSCIVTSDINDILNDDSIKIVVELMGGVNFAKDCVINSLRKGKHVVTANKALIATHMNELYSESLKSKGSISFEAAVAGGIPVIAAFKKSFCSNEVKTIYSIVNGTCNYILTEMADKSMDFPVALKDAMNKGYAEADPSFDIEGIDAAHKITILASLAFGRIVNFNNVKNIKGITEVSIHDINIARKLGFEIKLIASTEITDLGIDVRVGPCCVKHHHPLSSVEGVYNAVYVESIPVGKTMFYGRGAGGDPTSSAVISDLINITNECIYGGVKYPLFYENMNSEALVSPHGNDSRYYIRIWAKDFPGVLAKIAGVLGKNNISIASVIQKTDTDDENNVPLFIITHKASEENMKNAKSELTLKKEDNCIKESPFIMRILE